MATAITALYGLGYTLADDDHGDHMEEDRASDKSSPDILRRHMHGGFENVHHNGGHHYGMGPTAGHPVPPMTPYATMLAGIGLNLTAVSIPPPHQTPQSGA